MEANTEFNAAAISTHNYEIARLESLLLSKPDHSITTLVMCDMIELAITETYKEMARLFPKDFVA